MKNIVVIFVAICAFLTAQSINAQFNTPTINGTISANEYGNHVNSQNQQSSGGQNWYMTWDDANLYVAVTSADLSQAAVIYIDRNPVSPPNGGTDTDGNLVGFNYDNTNFSALPFRADFVAFFKDGYREYRTANGSGGWSSQTAGFGNYASGTGNVRELTIPWSVITGGSRPASFNFFSYVTDGGGFVYGQVPTGNPGGNIGTSAVYSRYYSVVNTNNGASTPPFSREQNVGGGGDIQYSGLKHDTFDSYYRAPFGAVPTGTTVNLKFRTDLADVSQVFLKVYKYNPQDGTTDSPVEYPLTFLENRNEGGTNYDIYSINYPVPNTPSIIYYKFRIADGTTPAFFSDSYLDDHDNLGQGGNGAASPGEPFPAFQITVYDANFTTPAWLPNSAVYQIFPDRFRNGDITNDWCRNGIMTDCPSLYGNGASANIIQTIWNTRMVDPRATPVNNNAFSAQFYGGDLKGVQDKLGYIQGLGFDTIYLNPIFKARSNHRYDADDYLKIADELGGDAAFTSLVNAANARGMRIILDGVWNHMSQDSEYFDYYGRSDIVGACENTSSVYRSWFNFFNTTMPCSTADYEGWFGFSGLPVFNENDAVKNFFYRTPNTNVTQYWYNKGASGWRFDVATDISHQWWNEYRGFAKTYKSDGPLIGEIFSDASQYLAGDQLDGVMNYRFRKNLLGFARGFDFEDNDNNGNNKIVGLTPSQFDRAMKSIREDYPLPAQLAMLNLIDSHDTNRALFTLKNSFESQTEAKERLKLAAVFQFTYIGAPMVYYGDEAGINAPSVANNGSGQAEDDPYNRAPYPWADEIGGSQNIYGPVDNSLLNFYTTLGVTRRAHPALRTGTFETLLMGDLTASSTDNNTFAFARVQENDKVIIILNNGTTANTVTIPVGAYYADGTTLNDALGNSSFAPNATTVSGGAITLTIPARSGAILSDLAPSAAAVSIGGKVLTKSGRGISGVQISMTDAAGNIRTARTNSFGFYNFEEIPVGENYILAAKSRDYQFVQPTQILFVEEDRRDVNFIVAP